MRELKVSVITIVYNGEKFIERTILSVLNQSFENIEYILIDGGSKDKTTQIIQKYSSNLNFWISEPDEGISDAFNKGLLKATGDIVGILNADDWYEPHTVETVVNDIDNCDIVYGNLQYWRGDSKEYLFSANHTRLAKEMCMNHPTVFVKRVIYQRLGLFDLSFKYAMDYELLLRFYLNGVSFKYINATLANMSMEGITDKNWKRGYMEVARAKIMHNMSPFKVYFRLYYQIIKTSIRRIFSNFGLETFVAYFRKHISIIKKTKSL